MPGGDRQLLPLDARECFEGRPGCGAAPRAVAVRRVWPGDEANELIFNRSTPVPWSEGEEGWENAL
jgi:hypothetical protein